MGTDRVYQKVIVSGHIIEVYEFEKPIQKKNKPKGSTPAFDGETGEVLSGLPKTPEQAKKDNARRAKTNLRRLVISNFDENDKFLTLTFRENITDVAYAQNEFNKFLKRLKRYCAKIRPSPYWELKFVKVVEFQKRGAVHFHLLLNLPYIEADKISELWGQGFIGINAIDRCDNIGAYLVKYIGKNLEDTRLDGRKKYQTSHNLVRPIELKGHEASAFIEEHKLDKKKRVFQNEYPSEFYGIITYKEYNTKRH